MSQRLVLQSPYHPTTFLERGVTVCFTTPALAGSRVRVDRRTGLEFIVPSFAGARGFYILPWSGIHEFCRPTLHDRQIQERAAGLTAVTPNALRQIASEVAAAGYAGPRARAAAQTQQEEDTQAQVVTNFNLLLQLISEVEVFAPELGKIADVEVRAKQAIAHAAQRLHSTPEIVADSLEQLASLFKAIGLGDAVETAACPRAAHRVRALRADMADWSTAHFGESATLAELVLATADLTLSCFPTLIAEARGLTKNVLDLVRRWQTNLNLIAGTLTRPQWLLDGWEPICAIWESAERNDTGQLSALHDMVQQVPVVPKEVGEWIDNTMEVNATRVFRRFTELNRDWRTGAPYLDQVAQNESRRALLS